MRFKQFILNENKAYLGQKVGDILTAAQELRDDSKNMGSRDLTRFSERIVNQIRRILHSNWPREEIKHLKVLQKVGVALMKAIEEKEDLPSTISGAAGTLEKLVAKFGTPINNIASQDITPEQDKKGISKMEKPDKLSAPPPNPTTIDNAGPANPPSPPGQDMFAPPLAGGNPAGQLTAM